MVPEMLVSLIEGVVARVFIAALFGWVEYITLPLRVWRFFREGQRYHFVDYVVALMSLPFLELAIEVAWRGEFSNAIGILFISGAGLGVFSLFGKALDRLGGPFAWYPGLGIRRSDGSFSPLGGRSSEDPDGTVLRGSQVADAKSAARARKRGDARALRIGGQPIAARHETEHFLICGKTGSGKTQAIEAMLRTVRERGEPALIADPAGSYYARFGRTDDPILNPFDARSAAWSPFAEIERDYDCDRLAHAAIPDAEGDSREWHFYARSLLAELLRTQHREAQASVAQLLRLVMHADSDELMTKIADTPAMVLCRKGNEKMLANTRAIAALYLNAWTYLPDRGTFSVRRWVREHQNRWLHLTYRDDQAALLSPLVATWIELALVEGLSLPDDADRRLWFVMDELDSLRRLGTLKDGLTKLRKHGGAVIAGLQTIAQLRATYGVDTAQTLLSSLSTKLILAAGDAETARYFEQELGEQEIDRPDSSSSETHGSFLDPHYSTGEQYRRDRRLQSTVLASEIQGLAPLRGFLKPVGGDIVRVTLPYQAMPTPNVGFEDRRPTPTAKVPDSAINLLEDDLWREDHARG